VDFHSGARHEEGSARFEKSPFVKKIANASLDLRTDGEGVEPSRVEDAVHEPALARSVGPREDADFFSLAPLFERDQIAHLKRVVPDDPYRRRPGLIPEVEFAFACEMTQSAYFAFDFVFHGIEFHRIVRFKPLLGASRK
jgi:hypothetical protein